MEETFKGFDEDDCVKFIRKDIPAEISEKYTDDEILYVVDIIWDFYEKKGLLSLNDIDTDDELLDPEELTKFVVKELRKDDEFVLDENDINQIVKAELRYEESLEDIL